MSIPKSREEPFNRALCALFVFGLSDALLGVLPKFREIHVAVADCPFQIRVMRTHLGDELMKIFQPHLIAEM